MDINPQNSAQQPISDDQELAKALAGVVDGPPPAPTPMPQPAADPSAQPAPVAEPAPAQDDNIIPGLNFEEAPVPGSEVSASAAPEPASETDEQPAQDPAPAVAPTPSGNGDLESIKKDALQELRPLMDKVELPPEEKFDTYLMLIRSTDDSSLIGPAHSAALAITDEKRRATALLEIIKEIDYLSHPDKKAT